jgi:RimJ/RimL family protein N-acetyltransferase
MQSTGVLIRGVTRCERKIVPDGENEREKTNQGFVFIRANSWLNVTVSRMSFDLQPHLKGKLIELRPLTSRDWGDLFTIASDPLVWEQHPESDRYKEDVFKIFFEGALESGGAFVVIDTKTQQIIGSTRFHGYDPHKSEIEIGWTFLARKYWGGRYNAEMKQLMLTHAFKFVENVVFFVGENNIRSQKATEKIGATKSGTAKRVYGNRPPSLNLKYVIRKSGTTNQHE